MKVGLNLVNLQTKKIGAQNMDKGSITTPKTLAFKGSNPDQIAHYVPEFAKGLFKGGGVGDVIFDIAKVFPDLDPTKEHFFFMPFYNADYYTEGEKTVVSPVMYKNQAYIIDDTRDITKSAGDLNKWKVNEVVADTMEKVDSTGKSTMTDIKLFEVDGAELAERLSLNPDKVKLYATLTPGTGTMPTQYGISYQDGATFGLYSENSRAGVRGMEKLHEITGGKFDPAYVVFHDYHGTAGMAHIQNAAINGSPLFRQVAVAEIVHNLGRNGYQGLGDSPFEFFSAYATPSQVKQLVGSQEYFNAVKMMPQDRGKALEELIKHIMPNMVDELDVLNPSMGPITLAKKVDIAAPDKKVTPVAKISTVSDPYAAELSEVPEMSEGLTKGLNEIREDGRFRGIINGSVYPTEKTLIPEELFNPHQANRIEMFFKDGKPVEYFETYDPASIKTVDDVFSVVFPVKQNNKIRYFERLVRREDIAPPKEINNWHPSHAVTSAPTRPIANVLTNINEETLAKLKANPDIVVMDSWGRGDRQKGIDELLLGFKKYVLDPKNAGDTDSILAVSASIGADPNSKKIKAILDELFANDKFNGRLLYLDGWCAPKAMTSASDYSLFTSREEPCGLTIPMARPNGAVVGASRTGGQQAMVKTGENPSGFLTEHSYNRIGRKEIEESSYGEEFKKAFAELIQKRKDEADLKSAKARRMGKNIEPLTEEKLFKSIMKTEDYQKLVNHYRDEIMSDEFKGIMEAMVKQTKDERAKMVLSGLVDELGWDSSYVKYKEFFWSEALTDPAKAAKIISQERLDALTKFTRNAGEAGGNLDINTRDIEKAIREGSNSLAETIREGFSGVQNPAAGKDLKDFIENIPFKGKIAAAAGATVLLATALWAVIAKDSDKKEEQKEKALSAATYVPSVPVNTFVKNA